MSGIFTIPELVDRVIDFLHDDLPSVRACSLVGRLWVAPAQIQCFRSITVILHTNQCARLLDMIRRKPYIGFHIQTLVISEHTESLECAYPRFRALMDAAPGVLELSFYSTAWFTAEYSSMDPVLWPGSLQSITVATNSPRGGHTFVRLVRTFPPLEWLRLVQIKVDEASISMLKATSDTISSRASVKNMLVDLTYDVHPTSLRLALDEQSPRNLVCNLTKAIGVLNLYIICHQFSHCLAKLCIRASFVDQDRSTPLNSDLTSQRANMHSQAGYGMQCPFRSGVPASKCLLLRRSSSKSSPAPDPTQISAS